MNFETRERIYLLLNESSHGAQTHDLRFGLARTPPTPRDTRGSKSQRVDTYW